MKVKIKTKGLEAGKRLDLKKADSWSLWDGDTLLEEKVPIPDAGLGLDHYKCIVNNDNTVSVVRFADLHRHSDNSLRDGILKVPDMVKHTEYAGALTDHGNLYGFVEYYNAMKGAGKKPIIGMEAYQENLQGELSRNHLILLAKDDVGYKNLIKLSSESFEHFYHKPHVTWEMLKQYHEGIICTTACLGGLIPKSFANGDRESAYYAAKQLLNIFGEDFYIEIQRHGIKDEELVNPQLLGLARELNIPIVATTDSHYLRKEDAYAHEVMMCLEQDVTIDMPHRRYEGTGYHLHSSEEMEKLFGDLPEALDNTLRIADKCNVTVKMGDVNLPNYEIPAPFATPLEYFKHICKTGFDERFQGKPEHEDPVYLERYDYEMSVIEKMGFETYFLIVWDFINYARSVNVYIGPGRGSAAGSLLAFCMGITDMDPIRFNLLFERFLNPERVSWPDIDTDIEHVGRQKVIDYITKKYGAESVCRIVTFGTMAAKMVIKDVARVMGYPPAWANNLAKLVPNAPKITLASAFEINPELRRRYSEEPDVARVIDVAKTLEGCKRHASQHACFEAGTPVLTDHGEALIEEVRIDDMVMTHKGRFQRVVNTMVTYTREVYDICAGGRTVTVTGNHPLLTDSNCWIAVKYLGEKADRLICRVGDSFRALPFTKTRRDVPEQPMYNLTVENDSSYIAGGITAHNCGLVVAPGKVENFLPTSMEKGEGGEKSLTSQVVMTEVEMLSLLKMDLLGLKNLSAIHEVMDTVKRTRGIDMKYQDLPLDDRDTYRMLAKGLTGGVFQLESAGMTDVIRQMLGDINALPDERMGECFERLIAAVALYRPGPMDYIPDYIKGMMDSSSIHYDCKQEEDILSSTYGVMVYQEQLMHIAQTLAGYSLGEADLLRKACGLFGRLSVETWVF